MTFVNLKAVFDGSSSIMERVTAAQNILMLELASQGWEEMPGRMADNRFPKLLFLF